MRIIGNDKSVPRQEHAVASGTLTNGKTVIVNADGTVSVVVSVQGATPTVFENANTTYTATTFDSNLNKIVIAYQDVGNSNYGTAVVGTVSGVSISFGTPVVFESARAEYISATFDSNANKVVIVYSDLGNVGRGTAVVGTVSGTSISFGSPTVFENDYLEYGSCTFDTNSNKVVIAYAEDLGGGTKYGTSVVGTVSGTSISFGSPVVFNNDWVKWVACTFDSNSNKVVICFRKEDTDYGSTVVGTVSGTSISYGSLVVFNSAGTSYISLTFDSNSNKVVVAYADAGNGGYGTGLVGTVSGTSISFGSEVVFDAGLVTWISATFNSSANKVDIAYTVGPLGLGVTGTVSGTSISFNTAETFENANSTYISSAFDSNANKTVVAYRDTVNSDHGTAFVFQFASTTLTSENYIGISRSGAASGAGAIIDIQGAIADNLSGLTAGQSYFVQTDGTLGTTAADPSVFAGTAVSATKLIVKG